MKNKKCTKLFCTLILGIGCIMLTGCPSNRNVASAGVNDNNITSQGSIESTGTLLPEDEFNYTSATTTVTEASTTTATTTVKTTTAKTTTEPVVVEPEVDEETLYKQKLIDEYIERIAPKKTTSTWVRDGAFYTSDNRISIFLEKESSFAGDTFSFGLYDNNKREWILPMSSDLEVTDGRVDWEYILENKDSDSWRFENGKYVDFVGDGYIQLQEDRYYYCYTEDILFSVNWYHYLIYANASSVITCNWNASTFHTLDIHTGDYYKFAEGPDYSLTDNGILVCDYSYKYSMYDFNGTLLFELPDYSYYSTSGIYNGEHLLIVAKGKDSGKYCCIIDNNGEIINEPILLEEHYETMLFDDYFTISYDAGDHVYFYDFDGSLIMEYDYIAS